MQRFHANLLQINPTHPRGMLTTFLLDTLVIYPGTVYAYNQISGELTIGLDLWRHVAAGDSTPPL
jgi:hypothetical protein